MSETLEIIGFMLAIGIMIYAVLISLSYLTLAIMSIQALKKHKRKNSYVQYRSILSSPLAPKISLIAPAYNESLSVVENIKSLLAIQYPYYEVVIVNDGSKDNSMEVMIKAFDLERVNYAVNYAIGCQLIKDVYKSTNPAYSNLYVVDKENGGKADALNAGINVSTGRYVACIDVDCIIEADALLRMVKPFMEQSNRRVIASGGVVRIANDCIIENGRMVEKNVPKKIIPRSQVLEYIRAFLLGRMAWGKLNGLLLISGAFGMFDKRMVIEAGGYDHRTVGEDMELVVRMRRMRTMKEQSYLVTFIPDPLCWTEAPADRKILGRQRNRWTRGTIETLRFHKKMFFNPRYGLLGMISYPYWFFFEWMAPWIEVGGVAYSIYLVVVGKISWHFFLLLLLAVYTYAIFISTLAIYTDQRHFYQYKSKGARTKLFITALLEPFYFHPFVVIQAIRGNIDYLRGKQSWGQMTRQGFTSPSEFQDA